MMTKLRRGPAPEPPRDIRGHLLACHERLRLFASAARKLGEASGATPAQLIEACQAVRRYFTVALPLHHEDEEASILPRLTQESPPPELTRALKAMEVEHRSIDRNLRHAIALWDAALHKVGARIEELFAAHLLLEETFVFPALDARLGADAREAILNEIRARREKPSRDASPAAPGPPEDALSVPQAGRAR
jgi:iron-sulfur cluster repair protein YtfE (RIC family)